MKSHNKKRNTGLLYEFLVMYLSRGLVEGDNRKQAVALRLLKKHFKPGTELHKEFRLINSLRKTTVSSEPIALSIVNEAKAAARSHDLQELDRQKSLLIKDINYIIKDDTFFEQHVPEYKQLATLQTLINDWRSKAPDLSRIASYEEQLVRSLTEARSSQSESVQLQHSTGEMRFLLGMMMKKLNERFSSTLTNEQRMILKAYALSTMSNDPRAIVSKMQEVKDGVVNAIGQFTGEQYVVEKLLKVRDQLLAENVTSIDDAQVSRFMLYSKLATELMSDE